MLYLPLSIKAVLALPQAKLSPASWAAPLYSSIFAIAVSYVIWYSSVSRIGDARTDIFTNIAPALSVLFARITPSEVVTPRQAVGAIIILAGFSLARPGWRPLKARGQPADRRPEASPQERPF